MVLVYRGLEGEYAVNLDLLGSERSGRAGVISLTGLMVCAFSLPTEVGKDQGLAGMIISVCFP